MDISVNLSPLVVAVICLTIVVLAGILAWYKHHN